MDGGGGSQAGWTGCWLELGVALDTAQSAGGASRQWEAQSGGRSSRRGRRVPRCPHARSLLLGPHSVRVPCFTSVCVCVRGLQPPHTRRLCPQQPAPGHPGAVGPWFRRQPGGPTVRTQPVPAGPSFLCRGSRQRVGAEGPPWLSGWAQPHSRRSGQPPACVQRPPQGQAQPCCDVAAGNSARTWRL